MNKNMLEVTIGPLTIKATGMAAVIVLASFGLIVAAILIWGGAPLGRLVP